MNERIKQLAKQTAIWHVTPREDLLEDFANALIKECIMVCWPGGESDVLYETATPLEQAFIDGQDECVEKLKQHFGIKSK